VDAQIDLYSHYFTFTPLSHSTIKAAKDFSYRFKYRSVIYNKHGQIASEVVKMFAAANLDRSVIRYHINTYREFLDHLKDKYIDLSKISIIEHPIPTFSKIDFQINPSFKPREKQIDVIDYIIDPTKPRFKLLALDTGEGKTISTFFAMSKLRKRTIALMRPGYIDRWNDEIKKVILNANVVNVIGVDLRKFIQKVMSNELDYDIALISNKTYYFFIKTYEKLGPEATIEEYGCTPDTFFENVKAEFRIIDEVHQDYHFNFRLDLYTHIDSNLSLSATLLHPSAFIERMYEIAYPKENRYYTKNADKFRKMISIFYTISHNYNILSSNRGLNAYSQLVYEKNLIKYKKVLKDYLEMISDIVYDYFIKKRDPEDKLIIFSGSVAMCEKIVDYLSKKYKDISIKKYTAEDDYSNLIDPVIRVTTSGSGGTAHDIPNLTTIINLIAIDSVQANLQMFGRLRNIPNKEVNYICLVDQDHPKHMLYHRNREKLLNSRCKASRHTVYSKVIGD
jgi:superfamily II DNA or RNA helicase